MGIRRVLSCVFLAGALAGTAPTFAADQWGTEFWLAIPWINSPIDVVLLEVYSNAPSTVSVSGAFVASGAVDAGSPLEVIVPEDAIPRVFETPILKGIRIVSDSEPVAVILRIRATGGAAGGDTALLLPSEDLGRDYLLELFATASPDDHITVVTATQDNTQVTIDPVCGGALPARTFNLDTGEVYQLYCPIGSDVTGTRIQSDKSVSVVLGDFATQLPTTSCCSDPIFYQATPTDSWGTRHLVPPLLRGTPTADSDYIRVLSNANGTVVDVDDGVTASYVLNEGEALTLETGNAAVIESSAPVFVLQYMKSAGVRGGWGDPTVIPILPDHSLGMHARFLAGPPLYDDGRFVTIVLGVATACSLTLDGSAVDGPFELFPDGVSRYITVEVNDGEHIIEASRPIAAYAHGYTQGGSYGSPVIWRSAKADECQIWASLCGPQQEEACVDDGIVLDASDSTASLCTGVLGYEWFKDGVLVSAWSDLVVVNDIVTDAAEYTVIVTCSSDGACTGERKHRVELSPDVVPSDQGNVLRAVHRDNDVLLEFPGAPATLWRLYADPDKQSMGSTSITSPDVSTTLFLDSGALLRPEPDYYVLRGVAPCSRLPGP